MFIGLQGIEIFNGNTIFGAPEILSTAIKGLESAMVGVHDAIQALDHNEPERARQFSVEALDKIQEAIYGKKDKDTSPEK